MVPHDRGAGSGAGAHAAAKGPEPAEGLALFPADREVPAHAAGFGVQVRLEAMELHRPRPWGACWLAGVLDGQLGLDAFWAARLPESREGTCWRHILQTLVCDRLIDPGSEWRLPFGSAQGLELVETAPALVGAERAGRFARA